MGGIDIPTFQSLIDVNIFLDEYNYKRASLSVIFQEAPILVYDFEMNYLLGEWEPAYVYHSINHACPFCYQIPVNQATNERTICISLSEPITMDEIYKHIESHHNIILLDLLK